MVHIPQLDVLRQLALPTGEYAVFGSGPLVVRGIVPFGNDLDVLCRGDAWNRVRELGDLEHLDDYGVDIVTMLDGQLTFGTSWGIGSLDVDELIDTAETILALPFVRLEFVETYKQIRNSEKDIAHLDALRAFRKHQD